MNADSGFGAAVAAGTRGAGLCPADAVGFLTATDADMAGVGAGVRNTVSGGAAVGGGGVVKWE